MRMESYPFVKRPDSYQFEFYRKGPNGRIRKVVEFIRLDELGHEIFNLAFGDWDENNQRINDLSVSNNRDSDVVLATVGATLIEFIETYPDAKIYVTGSTASRTSLYQMGLAKVYDDIRQQFEVLGFVDMSWEPFQRGINYSAFLLRVKHL